MSDVADIGAPSAEYRVFGPPGTGKTTFLSRNIHNAARARGSDKVVVASFTRAAATELAGRQLPVPRGQLGTLHALAYRCLDRPEVAEGHLDDWNRNHPHLAIGAASDGTDEPTWDERADTGHGDQLLQACERLRANMRPIEGWPTSVRAFYDRWCEWKHGLDLLDFTDMIEMVEAEHPEPPGGATVGFFDEVQDFTPLELRLVRRWAQRMDTVLLAGDDDQMIYGFKGATPTSFLEPELDEDRVRVLSESFRVPRRVHRAAQRWIGQLTYRQPKEYEPRDAEGSAWTMLGATWRAPERIVSLVEERVDAGGTVMVLGACGYMLDPLRRMLRSEGVPFHNPYRRRRGDWNPLATRANTTGSAERVLAYLRPDGDVWGAHSRMWNADDLVKWTDPVRAKGVLAHGAKKRLREWAKAGGVEPVEDLDLLASLFAEGFDTLAQGPMSLDLDWLRERLLDKAAGPMGYAIDVAKRRGAGELLAEPRCIIGTVHSVKGGEADTVVVLPDVSRAGMREWMSGGVSRDSVVRQFYVAMTRAREELVVAAPASPAHVPLRRALS